MELPNTQLRNKINTLWHELHLANRNHEEKVGCQPKDAGSILNAYREADISFEQAKDMIAELPVSDTRLYRILLVDRNKITRFIMKHEANSHVCHDFQVDIASLMQAMINKDKKWILETEMWVFEYGVETQAYSKDYRVKDKQEILEKIPMSYFVDENFLEEIEVW